MKKYTGYLKLAIAFKRSTTSFLNTHQNYGQQKSDLKWALQQNKAVEELYHNVKIFLVWESSPQLRLHSSELKKILATWAFWADWATSIHLWHYNGWGHPAKKNWVSWSINWLCVFDLPFQVMSKVLRETLEGFSRKIEFLFNTSQEDLVLARLASYAHSHSSLGDSRSRWIGFIDGTINFPPDQENCKSLHGHVAAAISKPIPYSTLLLLLLTVCHWIFTNLSKDTDMIWKFTERVTRFFTENELHHINEKQHHVCSDFELLEIPRFQDGSPSDGADPLETLFNVTMISVQKLWICGTKI